MGQWPFGGKRFVEADGRRIAYTEAGSPDGQRTFVLLHGNPTSSFLWRFVIPPLEPLGRCVAPDLIGMGDSDKLLDSGPQSYTLAEHGRYLDAALDALELGDRVVLVVHDWGSALGFDWARRHPDRVGGIAYMEAITQPLAWEDFPGALRPTFEAFRSPAGEEMVLEQNAFVEGVLPGAIMRELSSEEMEEYRRPFREAGEARRPTLTWPRQLPLDGEPADVVERVSAYAEWLAGAPVPKLLVAAEPGAILVGDALKTCRAWPEQQEITVPGIHFIQEDHGEQIGRAIADWVSTLD